MNLQPHITKHGSEYTLISKVEIPKSREEVFEFFANPKNLELMTPSLLKFKITELAEGPLKKGSTISYRLRIRGIPIRWQSVISAWSPPSSFEDTQVRGPYRQWIHQHLFHEHGNNTIMEDRVRYRVLGGSIIHALFVRKDLLNIFNYRTECMLNHFKAEGESSEL